MWLTSAILLITTVLFPIASFAIDCKKASSPIEKAICASPKLLELDNELNQVFKHARHAVGIGLTKSQRNWRQGLACSGDNIENCVSSAYRARIKWLKSIEVPPINSRRKEGSVTTISYHQVYPYELSYTYPEFDKTSSPSATQINSSLLKMAKEYECSCDDDDCTGFNSETNVAASILKFKSRDFVKVDYSTEYFCGGLHPENILGTDYLDMKTGLKSNVFTLSETGRRAIMSKFVAMAQDQDREDPSGCSVSVAPVGRDKVKFSLDPAAGDPHQRASCDRELSLPLSESSQYFNDPL